MKFSLKKEYGLLKEQLSEKAVTLRSQLPIQLTDAQGNFVYEDLPPMAHDKVFKKVMCSEENKEFACHVIGTLYDVDENYLMKNIALTRNELNLPNLKNKQRSVDFIGIVDDVVFLIEMNNRSEVFRNSLYAHILFAQDDLMKGETKYREIHVISFNNYTVYGKDQTIAVYETSDGEDIRLPISYVDVYLPVIKEKYEAGLVLNDAESKYLSMFIACEEEAKMLAKGDETMIKMVTYLKKLKQDDKFLESMREDSSTMQAQYELGQEIGLEKGLETTATNMLKDGLPEDVIQKYTKLPLEKIQNLAMTL